MCEFLKADLVILRVRRNNELVLEACEPTEQQLSGRCGEDIVIPKVRYFGHGVSGLAASMGRVVHVGSWDDPHRSAIRRETRGQEEERFAEIIRSQTAIPLLLRNDASGEDEVVGTIAAVSFQDETHRVYRTKDGRWAAHDAAWSAGPPACSSITASGSRRLSKSPARWSTASGR